MSTFNFNRTSVPKPARVRGASNANGGAYGIERAQVVTVGSGAINGVRHEIADNGEWSYTGDNWTTCGLLGTGVESLQSGGLLMVTCRSCARGIRARIEAAQAEGRSE